MKMKSSEQLNLCAIRKYVQDLTLSPLHFLQGKMNSSALVKQQCKKIYDYIKSAHGSDQLDFLAKLHINGLDKEQVWSQIEFHNKTEAATCWKVTDSFLATTFHHHQSMVSKCDQEKAKFEGDTVAIQSGLSEEDSSTHSDSDFEDDGKSIDSKQTRSNAEGKVMHDDHEKSEVDDEFFSLNEMENFLDAEDAKHGIASSIQKEGDINYFEDISSSGSDKSDEEWNHLHNARNMTYEKYFGTNSSPCTNAINGCLGAIDVSKSATEEQSVYQKHQRDLLKKVKTFEHRSLTSADWQMKGEIKATSRPENSLLQECLRFDGVAGGPKNITEEHTTSIEDIVKQRIIDEAWDDVKVKYARNCKPQLFKKKILFDAHQSELPLSEIYENDYMKKVHVSEQKEIDDSKCQRHLDMWEHIKDLFKKLDELSNYNFLTHRPEPKIKLVNAIPMVAREEIQPIIVANAQILAPQEIYVESAGKAKLSQEKMCLDNEGTQKRRGTTVKINQCFKRQHSSRMHF